MRLRRIDLQENFGDFKKIESEIGNLFELRFHLNAGYRIYYTRKGNTICLLLNGGNKSSQKKDIKAAEK